MVWTVVTVLLTYIKQNQEPVLFITWSSALHNLQHNFLSVVKYSIPTAAKLCHFTSFYREVSRILFVYIPPE
jgi:hypothetical protein